HLEASQDGRLTVRPALQSHRSVETRSVEIHQGGAIVLATIVGRLGTVGVPVSEKVFRTVVVYLVLLSSGRTTRCSEV
ncbi:MAG: hypothetical protein ACXVPL_02205, partial [Actinomycetota bacterium]